MLNTNRLLDLMATKKITKAKLCKTIDLGRSNFDNILNGADVRVSTLEKIAQALGVPVGYFFDEDTAAQGTVVTATDNSNAAAGNITLHQESSTQETQLLRQQIEQLQSQLRDKETIIQLLRPT